MKTMKVTEQKKDAGVAFVEVRRGYDQIVMPKNRHNYRNGRESVRTDKRPKMSDRTG